jgi:hypothetical protein
MSYRNWTGFAGTPAHAIMWGNSLTNNGLAVNALNTNALNTNALTAQGPALADLNGIAVEAVALPERAAGALVVADDWEARLGVNP